MSDFFTLPFFTQLVMSALGSIGFAMIYRVAGKYLPLAALGGVLTFAVYYTVEFFGLGVFAAATFSSAFSALFSEIFAKIKRAPVSIFLLPCSIPIVPGSGLYYTIANFIAKDFAAAWHYLGVTLGIGLGIACGIVVVPVLWHLIFGAITYLGKRKKKAE
ncbi:MAG: threonine/serine exporter family protein [Clostridia bacterium]|nr:threonine/serine exporter family protein [Clostridia bacterium]